MMRFIAGLLLLPLVVGGNYFESTFSTFVKLHGDQKQGQMTATELQNFIKNISYTKSTYLQSVLSRAKNMNANCTNCRMKCKNISEILTKFDMDSTKKLNSSDIEQLAPDLFLRLQNPYCYVAHKEEEPTSKPSPIAVWGYSFLMVTIINGCALLGFTFTPFMGRRVYKLIMAFMIALAVGSLAGSAVLFLLPDALRLSEMESALPDNVSYVWKSSVVMGGIYMFFLLERFLKYMIGLRGRLSDVKSDASCSMNIRRMPDADAAMKEMPHRHDPCGEGQTNSVEEADFKEEDRKEQDNALVSVDNGVSANGDVAYRPVKKSKLTGIAPVAWMIIFGDGVHNFIDGLSIGAAFSHNIVSGFSLSVAVLCEELPHELGDFAILLNSGMSMKMAMLFNFLSACMCYVGLVLGILIGEHTDSAVFIFAIAAGMFLYISLVDMMPEVIQLMESDDAKSLGRVKIFVIQNIGLFMGYGILLLMAVYGDKITFNQ